MAGPPAPGTVLCLATEVPDGGCRELYIGEGLAAVSLLLYRRGGEVRAYVNSCPHFSLPLNARPDEFLLMDGERIMCAWHCAVFRLTSGECLEGPAQGMGLAVVPVHVAGGQVVMGAAPAQAAAATSAAAPAQAQAAASGSPSGAASAADGESTGQ